MSAYYDLLEKPDIRQTGEQQPLYARFIPKGTIERKEFLNRVHLFTGISRSLLEGAMASFMDELRDCLADGWTVEFGELGYFTPSLNCRREVNKKILLERHPQSSSKSESFTPLLSVEQRFRLLDEYLQQEQPCINRAQYARLTGRSVKQAVTDLNLFIEDGLLIRCGAGKNVVYMKGMQK